uniref:DNA-directed RNA polymerase subunit Rpo10 n=1 Tax=Ignisphaera aggregans TaxID=334771 RepID=A0A7J3QF65_9CREN
MMIPVRCFTCGYPIGAKWEEFYGRVSKGEDPKKVLDDLGIKRYCCRRILLSHIELFKEMMRYGTVK